MRDAGEACVDDQEGARLNLDELDERQLLQLQRAAKRSRAALEARDNMVPFMCFTHPEPQDPEDSDRTVYDAQPHHRLLGEIMEKVDRGEMLRVAISMPPQHGKSEQMSRGGPAWLVGRRPHRNIMFGTYNQDFANEFGDDVRAVIQSHAYRQVFPRVELRTGSKAKDHMVTTAGGKLSFLGRGGSGTGRPADIFIIDDPIKDDKEARSITVRNDVWKWFNRVVSTRLHGLSVIVIIQTRWSHDDLIGRLTDQKNRYYRESVAKQWRVINLPAILDDAELAKALGRKVGEPLWPTRFPLTLLESARTLDPEGFSALYQGRPTPPEGSFYKRDMLEGVGYTLDQLPKNLTRYGSCDLAVSPEKDADKSCVGDWGIDSQGCAWLLPHIYWERKAADDSVEKIWQMGKEAGWISLFGETGQISRSVGPFLTKRMDEEGVYFEVIDFPTGGSKASKSVSFRGRLKQGKVKLPKFASWYPEAEEQMLKFTGIEDNEEDDFCDMLARLGQGLEEQFNATPSKRLPDNVIPVGTFGWTVAAARREKELRARRKVAKGF